MRCIFKEDKPGSSSTSELQPQQPAHIEMLTKTLQDMKVIQPEVDTKPRKNSLDEFDEFDIGDEDLDENLDTDDVNLDDELLSD